MREEARSTPLRPAGYNLVGPQRNPGLETTMALRITDDCISCGACEPECPNEAIGVRIDIYVIHTERCTECVGFHREPACQDVCPVECCLSDPDHEESEEGLVQKVLALHPDDEKLRERVASHDIPSHFRH